MREIPLTNHREPALVDDDIFELASRCRWRLRGNAGERSPHVVPTGGAPLKYLHHYALKPPPGMVVDHRNGDPLDNQRGNLRVATKQQNAWNRAPQRGRSSPHGGVSKIGDMYYASIKGDGVRFHLGVFADEQDAAMAVDRAAITLHGEFTRLNIGGIDSYPLVFPSQRLGLFETDVEAAMAYDAAASGVPGARRLNFPARAA